MRDERGPVNKKKGNVSAVRIGVTGWRTLAPSRVTALKSLAPTFTLKHLRKMGFCLYRTRLRAGLLEIFYAPFDPVNLKAKVMIVGITPGWTQLEIALRSAKDSLAGGVTDPEELGRRAWHTASFAGSMRTNLIEMLDGIDLPQRLQIDLGSTLALFSDSHKHLLRTASVIRCPVFIDGQNYTGHRPKLLETSVLREFAETVLAEQLQQVPSALVVPLGKAVSEVMTMLITQQKLDPRRCLLEFPHPSGANGHRKRQYQEARASMKAQVAAWFRRTSVVDS